MAKIIPLNPLSKRPPEAPSSVPEVFRRWIDELGGGSDWRLVVPTFAFVSRAQPGPGADLLVDCLDALSEREEGHHILVRLPAADDTELADLENKVSRGSLYLVPGTPAEEVVAYPFVEFHAERFITLPGNLADELNEKFRHLIMKRIPADHKPAPLRLVASCSDSLVLEFLRREHPPLLLAGELVVTRLARFFDFHKAMQEQGETVDLAQDNDEQFAITECDMGVLTLTVAGEETRLSSAESGEFRYLFSNWFNYYLWHALEE